MTLRIKSDSFTNNSELLVFVMELRCVICSRTRTSKYDLNCRKAPNVIQKRHPLVRSEVLTALSVIFRDVSPCSLVEVFRSFGWAYCVYLQGRNVSSSLFSDCLLSLLFVTKDKGGGSSETSANLYQSPWRRCQGGRTLLVFTCSQESEEESRGHCSLGLKLAIITREPVWSDYMHNRRVKEVAGCSRNMNPSQTQALHRFINTNSTSSSSSTFPIRPFSLFPIRIKLELWIL
jgi:hypothetical protein